MRKSMKTSITLATTGALVLGGAAFGISTANAATPNVQTVSSSSEASKIPPRSHRSPRSRVATPPSHSTRASPTPSPPSG